MKLLIATLICFSFISTSFAKDDKKRSPQRKPASESTKVTEGGQTNVYKFFDKVEGKNIVCYFTNNSYNNAESGAGIHCIELK